MKRRTLMTMAMAAPAVLAMERALGDASVRAAMTYSDPKGRFTFTFPDGYMPFPDNAAADSNAALFQQQWSHGASWQMDVVVEMLSTALSVDDFARLRVKTESDLQGFQLDTSGIRAAMLGGQPARQYEFSYTVVSSSGRSLMIHEFRIDAVIGSTAYSLTFPTLAENYSAAVADAASIISSFAFSPAAIGATVPAPMATAMTAPASSVAPLPTGPVMPVSPGSFTDALGRFTFTPPDGFTLMPKSSSGGYALFSNGQKAWVSVTALSGSGTTLDDFVGQRYTNAMQQKGYEFPMGGIQTATLDGQSARQYEHFQTSSDGTRFHYLTVFASYGNIIGRVDLWAPDSAWADISPALAASLGAFHFLTGTYPTTFTSSAKKFTLPLPFGWQWDISLSNVNGTEDALVGFSPSLTVYAGVVPVASGVTVDTVAANEITGKPGNTQMFMADAMTPQPIMLGGQPALMWEYTNGDRSGRYRHRILWAVMGGNRYRLSINAAEGDWAAALKQAQPVVDGFTFVAQGM